MRDWRGFSGFSGIPVRPVRLLPHLCVCVYVCLYFYRDSVTSAAACCDWDMVPSGSPGRDLRTCALYRYRCRFIHAPRSSFGFIPAVPLRTWEGEKPRKPRRSERVFQPKEKRRGVVRCGETRCAFTWSFNILNPPCPNNQFFSTKENIQRTALIVKYELFKIIFSRAFFQRDLNWDVITELHI